MSNAANGDSLWPRKFAILNESDLEFFSNVSAISAALALCVGRHQSSWQCRRDGSRYENDGFFGVVTR
jgi:hypothetical protein